MNGVASRRLDPTLAAAYAKAVTAPREAFAKTFDFATAASIGEGYLDFKMTALGAPNDHAAFEAAFVKASERGFLNALLASLIELRQIDFEKTSLGKVGLTVAEELGLTPQDATALTLNPQGWTPQMTNMLKIADMVPGLLMAIRRVCAVVVDGTDRGTGFLVGPQTMLTNWHVVHDLIDPSNGAASRDSHRKLVCVFDNFGGGATKSEYAAVEDWLVDWSPMDVKGHIVPGGYQDMTSLRSEPWLDFAVIRLAGAPGRARGWYDVSKSGSVLTAKDPQANQQPFFVVQHPAQQAQHLSVATGAHFLTTDAHYIQHFAPTLQGSSGGLCLDFKFQPVALHQAEVTKQENGRTTFAYNRAIATKAIAERAPRIASVDSQHDAIWFIRRSQRAVVGRVDTLSKIATMRDPNTTTPILIVRGGLGSGRTFTTDLIEDRIEHAQQWFARLDARALPAEARDLANNILEQAGVAGADRERLPKAQSASTTDVAWIKNQLLPEFRQILTGVAAGRTLWIVLENLDVVDLTLSSARTFLNALYELAPSMSMVRIVLLGLDGGLPAGDPESAIYDDLRPPDSLNRNEIETFIAYVCTERKIPITINELQRLGGLVLAVAGQWPATESPNLRLTRLGEFLTKILYTTARNW